MRLYLKKQFLTLALAIVTVALSVQVSAAQNNYAIKPGDTLQIEVLEDSSLNRATLVLPDGTISFPLAGTIRAGGRSVDEVGQSLSQALASNFAATPNVFVSIGALAQAAPSSGASSSREMDIYALGEFTEPGRKEVKRGTTLLQFLAEAGGLSRFAAEKRIELLRTDSKTGQVTTYLFNYRTPAGGEKGINGGTKLISGDVVRVPQRRLFE